MSPAHIVLEVLLPPHWMAEISAPLEGPVLTPLPPRSPLTVDFPPPLLSVSVSSVSSMDSYLVTFLDIISI